MALMVTPTIYVSIAEGWEEDGSSVWTASAKLPNGEMYLAIADTSDEVREHYLEGIPWALKGSGLDGWLLVEHWPGGEFPSVQATMSASCG